MEKENLADLVAVNLCLTKVVAELTYTNTCLVKRDENWLHNNSGGGGSGSSGFSDGKWCKMCKCKI